MFNCQLCDFQSFIEVCLGLCIAYLALPRLRYRHRIEEAFLRFGKEKNACIAPYIERKKVKKKGEQKNENSDIEIEDTSAFRDSSLTDITEKERRFSKNEHGSWFFKHCFKPKTKIWMGKDQVYVSVLVVILFFLLLMTTIIPQHPASASVFVSLLPFVVRWDIFIIGWGFFTVLFLISLVWSGIKHIAEIENSLKDALSNLKSTYSTDPHEISISEMTTKIP